MFETNGLKGMYLQGVEKNRALSTRGQPDMSTCTALPRGARSVACPSVVEGFFLSRHVHVPTRLAMEGTTGRQGTAPRRRRNRGARTPGRHRNTTRSGVTSPNPNTRAVPPLDRCRFLGDEGCPSPVSRGFRCPCPVPNLIITVLCALCPALSRAEPSERTVCLKKRKEKERKGKEKRN